MGGALWTAGRRRWAADLFTASLARQGGPGGRTGSSSEEAKELKSRFCAETPERSPEKQNQSAELEQEAEGGRRNSRGGTGGGRKHSREPR